LTFKGEEGRTRVELSLLLSSFKCTLNQCILYLILPYLAFPRPTQPSILPGSVNEYQLRLERQRQVWFIPLSDVRGVCR